MRHTEYRHLSDVGGLISHKPRVRNTISYRIYTYDDVQTQGIIVAMYIIYGYSKYIYTVYVYMHTEGVQ